MRSIESNKKDFGVYWTESFFIDDHVYGNVKIRIGDRLYPENNDSYDNYQDSARLLTRACIELKINKLKLFMKIVKI